MGALFFFWNTNSQYFCAVRVKWNGWLFCPLTGQEARQTSLQHTSIPIIWTISMFAFPTKVGLIIKYVVLPYSTDIFSTLFIRHQRAQFQQAIYWSYKQSVTTCTTDQDTVTSGWMFAKFMSLGTHFKRKLKQLERVFWEYPPPPHDYPYYWFISDPKF